MLKQKKHDNTSEETTPSPPTKLTRRDALKRIALTAVGIAALPMATFMSPGEALADEIHAPRYRSYARDFYRSYGSYASYTSYTSGYQSYQSYYSYYSSYTSYYYSYYIKYGSYFSLY